MKCPHCNYEYGWSGELMMTIKGDKGEFFKMPIVMQRTAEDGYKELKGMRGCPSCDKVFIAYDWE